MSCSGYAAGASCEAIEIQVLCLNGEGCNFTLTGSSLGHELRQMVLQGLPSKKGRTCVILYENSQLLLHQTLQEQGIVGKTATLRCTFVPTDLYAACCYTQGLPVPEGRESTRGSDEDTMCRQQGVFATPSQHSWDTSFLPKFQPDPGGRQLAKRSSESDVWK